MTTQSNYNNTNRNFNGTGLLSSENSGYGSGGASSKMDFEKESTTKFTKQSD
jgi:hypothetical protein